MLGSLGTCGCQSPLDCGQRFIVSCHAHVGWLSDLIALKFVSVQFARIFNCCSLLCFYLLSLPILSLLGSIPPLLSFSTDSECDSVGWLLLTGFLWLPSVHCVYVAWLHLSFPAPPSKLIFW